MVDIEKRNELVVKYIPLADKLARSRKKSVNRTVAYDDLRSAAYVGLIDAAEKFDEKKVLPGNSDPFARYASCRIAGQMTDYLRKCVWLGRRDNPVPVYSIETSAWSEGKSNSEHVGTTKDALVAKFTLPEDYLNQEQLFNKIIRCLPPLARSAFRLYYLKGMTMKQIGEVINLSESRVSQLISQHKPYLNTVWENKKCELFEEAAP